MYRAVPVKHVCYIFFFCEPISILHTFGFLIDPRTPVLTSAFFVRHGPHVDWLARCRAPSSPSRQGVRTMEIGQS